MTQEFFEAIKSTFESQNIADDKFNIADLFSSLTLADDPGELRRWALGRGMKAGAFDHAYTGWRVCKELGRQPQTAKEFVELYAAWRGITARYNSRLDSPKGSVAELDMNTAQLAVELRLYRGERKLPFGNSDIEDAVTAWLRDQRNARRSDVWAAIYRDEVPDAEAEWQRFVGAIVDTSKTSTGYAVAALKSTMWQVKRKLVGEAVYHHLMAVFYGGQGSGKSEAVRRMAAPMTDLMMAVNFRTITDTKNMELWSFPLVFCDEMDQASRADVDSIKNAITKEENSDRGHSSHNMITVRNGATFIGCCNSTLGERINDNTGMRRFAPIASREEPTSTNIAAGLPVSDFDTINDIDFALLWQSVDHRADHPMMADPMAFAEWRKLADAERAQDSVESWLKEFKVEAWEKEERSFNGATLYSRYAVFCQDNGYSQCAANMLGKKMRNYVGKPWYPFDPPHASNGKTVHKMRSSNIVQDNGESKIARIHRVAANQRQMNSGG